MRWMPTRSLRAYFDHNAGPLMHKWLHYFPIYQHHLRPFRGRRVTVLEIGVSHGGSLKMWRSWLGRRAHVVGVDIEPRVAGLAEPGIDIMVGDQSDPVFLAELARRHGPFDVVIDDGGHIPAHQIASIEALWPHVRPGGIYLVEDLHSNYWPEMGGRRGAPDTFIAWLGARLDDLHAFHSREDDFQPNDWTSTIAGIHLYDSVAVLDKCFPRPRPEHRKTGFPVFDDVYGRSHDEMLDEHHRRQIAAVGHPLRRMGRLVRHPVVTTRRVLARRR